MLELLFGCNEGWGYFSWASACVWRARSSEFMPAIRRDGASVGTWTKAAIDDRLEAALVGIRRGLPKGHGVETAR